MASANEEPHYPIRTLASTKSLRPKPYKRPTILSNVELEDEEIFLNRSIKTLQTGTFLQIHTKCQLDKHERVHYKQDKLNKFAEDIEKERKLQEREKLRNELLDANHKLHATNTKFIEDIAVNWKATQKVKRDRQIRDLQYELSLIKKEELNTIRNKNHYNREGTEGISDFEKIMRRNGIGADEGGGPPLSISYEQPSNFQDRISNLAKSQWPTNEEVSDFVTQLKDRTQEKRAARYEKARRRRRAAVGQQDQAADEEGDEEEEEVAGKGGTSKA